MCPRLNGLFMVTTFPWLDITTNCQQAIKEMDMENDSSKPHWLHSFCPQCEPSYSLVTYSFLQMVWSHCPTPRQRLKWVQNPMEICVLCLSLCNMNTSTQFYTSHFYRSRCRKSSLKRTEKLTHLLYFAIPFSISTLHHYPELHIQFLLCCCSKYQ